MLDRNISPHIIATALLWSVPSRNLQSIGVDFRRLYKLLSARSGEVVDSGK
jgi:hypothetical protein